MSRLTKLALLDAFTVLLQKKPFSKITIQDITSACGISRMTFYYHFDDIYDMIDWAIKEKLQKAVDTNFTYDTWKQGYINVFKAVLEEKTFFLKVFPSIDLRRVELYLYAFAHRYILNVVNEKLQKMVLEVDEKSKNLICDIYGYAMVGCLLRWISTGMREEPEELVEQFAAILHGTLEQTLRQASDTTSGSSLQN